LNSSTKDFDLVPGKRRADSATYTGSESVLGQRVFRVIDSYRAQSQNRLYPEQMLVED